jgi:hypothetical protein
MHSMLVPAFSLTKQNADVESVASVVIGLDRQTRGMSRNGIRTAEPLYSSDLG